MTFLLTLLTTLMVAILARPAMQKVPWVFYLICIALDVALLALSAGLIPQAAVQLATMLLRRGFIAISLFVIVMYIGVFPYGSKVRNYFSPVRAVLAICACILALGHVAAYFATFIPRLFEGNLSSTMALSMFAGLGLLTLLLVLGITSFRGVRKAMGGRAWLRLQKASYLFYALIYVHSMCLLIPSALQHGKAAQTSVLVYSVVFGAYAVARVVRAIADHRQSEVAAQLRQEELELQAV
uniref:Ferric oxidoreductase domain-containing protein n=1 Tax=Muribaculaceae bacterium Z82 TaxID=2304548 RepID=A0A7C9P5A6_9BACT